MSRILLIPFFAVTLSWGQVDFLLDVVKDGVKDGVKQGTHDLLVDGVKAVVNGETPTNSNASTQPSPPVADPQVYQQNAALRAELIALHKELAELREQQQAQQIQTKKNEERAKLKAIADLSLDPFDPLQPFPTIFPDL